MGKFWEVYNGDFLISIPLELTKKRYSQASEKDRKAKEAVIADLEQLKLKVCPLQPHENHISTQGRCGWQTRDKMLKEGLEDLTRKGLSQTKSEKA